MFSGELPSLRNAWSGQQREALIGALIGTGTAVVFVSARLAVFFLLLLTLTWIASRWRETDVAATLGRTSGVTIALGTLALYALISVTWSAVPEAALGKVAQLFAITLAVLVTVRIISGEPRRNILRPSEGLWLGSLIGLTYYLGEGLTGQGIKLGIINALELPPKLFNPPREYAWEGSRLVQIGGESFTRNATPATLLLWPALLAARGAIASPWGGRVAALIALVTLPAVLLSPHEASKLALAAGAAAFALACLSGRWAYRAVLTLWIVACLAVVPAALLAHQTGLHKAEWLQSSARHRIVIWNSTAEQVLKAPVLGLGAYTVYVAGESLLPPRPPAPDEEFQPTLSRHSHNAFLQTWLELGAVGALLLTAAGWQVLARIRRLDTAIQPYGLAAFSSASALLATSYGIWQIWYMSLLGLAPILFALGARAFQGSARRVSERALAA